MTNRERKKPGPKPPPTTQQLEEAWARNGADGIRLLREVDPVAYVKAVARLVGA